MCEQEALSNGRNFEHLWTLVFLYPKFYTYNTGPIANTKWDHSKSTKKPLGTDLISRPVKRAERHFLEKTPNFTLEKFQEKNKLLTKNKKSPTNWLK